VFDTVVCYGWRPSLSNHSENKLEHYLR
jgi:hypothetical protein